MGIRLAAASAALLFSLIGPNPVFAGQAMKSQIVQVAGAPVNLLSCVSQSGGADYVVPEFTNTARQAIDAVEIKVDVYDAFGTKVDSLKLQKAGTFSPGAPIRAKRVFGILNDDDMVCLDYIPNAASASCSVDRVKYADGTTWSAPASAA